MDVSAGRGRTGERGLTLLELVLAATILGILAASALPLYQVTVKREREIELRRALRDIHRAIDEFHRSYLASGGAIPGGSGPDPRPTPTPPPTPPPTGTPRPGGGPPLAQGPCGGVPLIDVSQFDPIDSMGYPPDLEILAKGVQLQGGGTDEEELYKYLRRIPLDPMIPHDTIDANDKNFGWGVRCYQDAQDATSWCRKNVWVVYSRSQGKGLDGVPYSEW